MLPIFSGEKAALQQRCLSRPAVLLASGGSPLRSRRAVRRSSSAAMPKGIPAPGQWDLPGDNVNLANEGLAEGEHIFIRMGTIVRARRLDLRLLMDAHDLHNRGFVEKYTFQRALAYAFGNQWNELGMTTGEFEEVIAPYETRRPQKMGDPISYVLWQKFANHVQKIADSLGTGKAGDY